MWSRVILATALMAVIACSTRSVEESAEAVLSYDLLEFHAESTEGCDSVGSTCAFYHVTYPTFYNLSESVKDSIRAAIDKTLTFGDPEGSDESFREAGQKFVDDYNRFVAEFQEPVAGWYFSGNVAVNILSDTLISLVTQTQFYTGGAHGGTGTYFTNIDPEDGAKITLEKIFSAATVARIEEVAETIFRDAYNLRPNESLAEAGYTFPEDQFSVNDNYGFTEDGLVFVYNIYEIAPYSMGYQEVVIPYEEIWGNGD